MEHPLAELISSSTEIIKNKSYLISNEDLISAPCDNQSFKNGEISLIKGSLWEIEMYGPTRQSEIILAPCMYQIDTWYEEIVSLGINGKKIYYIELYVLRDFKELIVNNNLEKTHPILKAVNYKQAFMVLNDLLNKSEMLEKSVFGTRQLAKRQITWMRSWKGLNFFDLYEQDAATEFIKKGLKL